MMVTYIGNDVAPKGETELFWQPCRYCDNLVCIPLPHKVALSILRKTGANPLIICQQCWSKG